MLCLDVKLNTVNNQNFIISNNSILQSVLFFSCLRKYFYLIFLLFPKRYILFTIYLLSSFMLWKNYKTALIFFLIEGSKIKTQLFAVMLARNC